MMQLIGISSASDDPEGSFVPPEFDNTGSTFEVRVAKPCQGFKSGHSFVFFFSANHTWNSGVCR